VVDHEVDLDGVRVDRQQSHVGAVRFHCGSRFCQSVSGRNISGRNISGRIISGRNIAK
jgi:hypothetical protein